MLGVRWKRSMLWIGLVVTLLVSMAPIITVSSGDGAMLSLDIDFRGESVVDPSYSPGSIFYVDFYIDDVVAMWGYDFWVWYNTSVLTATDFESVAPFTTPQGPGGEINDTAGYVALRYSYPMAEPNGLTTTTPVWIAWIEFTVDDWGWSTLQLYGPPPDNASKIVDIYGSPINHDVVTGFFANVADFPHDIAITTVEVSPTRNIIPGEFVSINVTVANQAPFNENFTVTVYANTTVVDSENISLAQLKSNTTQFDWDTTGFPFGHYNIRAEASAVPNETETANNLLIFDDIIIVGTHDIAITNVTASPKNVTTGDIISINVTVMNQGNFTESFNVTAKYGYVDPWPEVAGEHVIDTKAVASMANGTSTILTFTWNTSDVAFKSPYTSVSLWIESNASVVPYETATYQANNKYKMDGDVTVWLTGPAASFTYSPVIVLEGGTVTFDASASYSVDSNITNYAWDFGDGNVTEVTVPTIRHIYTENGTYTVSLTVTDDKGLSSIAETLVTVYRRDIAIVSVVPSLTRIAVGESMSISVTVVNQGDYGAETFNVTAYYGTTAIGTLTVTNLALGASQTLTFDWDTTGVSPGTYSVKAVTSVVSGEIRTDDNTYTFDGAVAILIRDVAVTKVTASPENVTTGDIISINVTVVNQGDYGAETFNVTAYYGTTAIGTLTVTNLALGASQTLTFTWNTTGVTPGTYTVKAVASVVPDEFDTGDNVRTVEVTVGEEGVAAGQDYTLYILAAAVLVIVLATLVYVLKIRKPKTP